ncbi:MAG: helix-turn-helix transcriptional regulator [Rhizobiales bacterium]|nr:helix-turn-helix transcriptional regulator [Hyphomicrobiales bacterium]NRB14320.1 helix-turn-helix transcriptional regulator [Hyphomicrobiales bacterium]
MNIEIVTQELELKTHLYGRIDRRMNIAPTTWPFHDLFWVHQGGVELKFTEKNSTVMLNAPSGVLIMPNTEFSGRTVDSFATVSICHFEYNGDCGAEFMRPGYQSVRDTERIHIQNQVGLAMFLAKRNDPKDIPRRQRALHAIIDGFGSQEHWYSDRLPNSHDRLNTAWEAAAENLNSIRTLSDVAALASINESRFRTLHRTKWKTSAGDYLRELRLKKAEELLATTGFTLAEISQKIGYRHTESFFASFKKNRGITPGEYRRRSKPFA